MRATARARSIRGSSSISRPSRVALAARAPRLRRARRQSLRAEADAEHRRAGLVGLAEPVELWSDPSGVPSVGGDVAAERDRERYRRWVWQRLAAIDAHVVGRKPAAVSTSTTAHREHRPDAGARPPTFASPGFASPGFALWASVRHCITSPRWDRFGDAARDRRAAAWAAAGAARKPPRPRKRRGPGIALAGVTAREPRRGRLRPTSSRHAGRQPAGHRPRRSPGSRPGIRSGMYRTMSIKIM